MDYITVDALRVHGAHGHYAHEREVEQEFEVSLRVVLDTHSAGGSDVLTDTIDYDVLRSITLGVFADTSKYLVEALAETIAAKVLAIPQALEVTISIRKMAVWDNGIPGISITRIAQ